MHPDGVGWVTVGMAAMFVLFVAAAYAAEPTCPAATTAGDFAAAAQAGETAFADLDMEALSSAKDRAGAALACLREPVAVKQAAAFHRLLAMAGFANHDFTTALAEFHAARRLEPGYAIPATVAPPGHPLVSLYDAALQAGEGDLEPVQAAAGGWILVDGVRGAARPNKISVILQRFDALGQIEASTFLGAGDPLPAWAVPPKAVSRKGLHVGLLAGTGGAVAVSAVLYGLALTAHDDFWNLENSAADAELPAIAERANTLTYASLGVVAVGLGTVTVVTW